MVLVRCAQTDLPKKNRKSVTDAVRLHYERIVEGDDSSKDASKKRNKAGRLGDYVKALKKSLDTAFSPHWHVMAGNSLGFACKNRKQTVGVWHIMPVGKDGQDLKSEGRLMVVIWKSPGIEPALTDAEREAAKSDPKADDETSGASNLHIVQPDISKEEDGSEVMAAVGVLKDVVGKHASADPVDLAKMVRRRLTMELGTIWHVSAGREFVIEPAENCRNFVLATFGKDMHIVCFQHEQFDESRIQWKKIISALPYLMVTIICFGYMGFQNLCMGDGPTKGANMFIRFFENRVCSKKDWEFEFGMLAIATMACSFVAKKLLKDE